MPDTLTDVASPDTEVASSAALSDAAADVPGDGYGSSTLAFGTEVIKVVPPKPSLRARIDGFDYECGATAHTVTLMVPVSSAVLISDAVAGTTTIQLGTGLQDPFGDAATNGDWIVLKNIKGQFDTYKVASYTGGVVTITLSVGSADGSGITVRCAAGVRAWCFGAPGDHVKRQFRMPASQRSSWFAPNGLCTSANVGEPLLIHSNNITANGYLTGPYYSHPKL